ncbi:MAG: phosphatidylserine decarboxylase [candidate division FCPU426 bacterium]
MRWPFAPEGRKWLAILVLVTVGGIAVGRWVPPAWQPAVWCFGVLSLSMGIIAAVFYRDPERRSTAAPDLILSAADGRVVAVETCNELRHMGGPAQRIAVFMHLGNVHVQRTPGSGKLLWTRQQSGRWLPAWSERAARENEQCWYAFEGEFGKYALVQIAGLVARRTRCWLQSGRVYPRGVRLGMITMGSEVDLYLPLSASIQVRVGDRVRAGETVLGKWAANG